MLGLVVASLILAQPATPPAPEPRGRLVDAPALLWEEGGTATWTQVRDDLPVAVEVPLMAPLFDPKATSADTVIVTVNDGARVVLVTRDITFIVLSGPQAVRLTPQPGEGVRMSRVAAPETGVADTRDFVVIAPSAELGPRTSDLPLLATTPSAETEADADVLAFAWPRSRAIRPPGDGAGPTLRWTDAERTPATRYAIEVEVVGSDAAVARVEERWIGIGALTLKLHAPWMAQRAYRVAIARGDLRASTETRVLSTDETTTIDAALGEARALRPALGGAAIAFEALVLNGAELDAEARIRWWHLGMAALGQGQVTRAKELFARSGAAWP